MENRHSIIRLIIYLALAAAVLFSLGVSFAEEEPWIDIFPQKSFKVGVGMDYDFDSFDTEADQYVHLLLYNSGELTEIYTGKAWDASKQEMVRSIPAGMTTVPGKYYLTLGPDQDYIGTNEEFVVHTTFMVLSESLDAPELTNVEHGTAPGSDLSFTISLSSDAVQGYFELYRINGKGDSESLYWDTVEPGHSTGETVYQKTFSIPGLYLSRAGSYQIMATALANPIDDSAQNSELADSETTIYEFALTGDDSPACPEVIFSSSEADYPDPVTYTVSGAQEVAYHFNYYDMVSEEYEGGNNGATVPDVGESGTFAPREEFGPGIYEYIFWAKVGGIWSQESDPIRITWNPYGYLHVPEVMWADKPVGKAINAVRTNDLTFTVLCENASWFACDVYEDAGNGEFSAVDFYVDVQKKDGVFSFSLPNQDMTVKSLYKVRITPYADGYCRNGAKEFTLSLSDSDSTMTWDLDDNGVLTIRGTGLMPDYEWGEAPWLSNSSAIKEIVIESGITSIGNYAFYGCSNVTSVSIPNTVTSIGQQTFSDCDRLTEITLPASVSNIGMMAFSYCPSLTGIYVDSASPYYTSENGVLFNNDQSTLVIYPGGKAGSYTVPGSVRTIGSQAFSECAGLTDVTISEGVQKIEWGAFESSSITKVKVPASVTQIQVEAFSNCEHLARIDVDSNNPNYASESGVFFNKAKTKLIVYPAMRSANTYTVPNGVKYIDAYAFSYNTSLTDIIIPTNLSSVEYYAFGWSNGLTDIWYLGNSDQWNKIYIETEEGSNSKLVSATLHYIQGGACSENLTWALAEGTLVISGTGEMNTYEGEDADPTPWYSLRDSITAVIIEDGVTVIGEDAFRDSEQLATVTMADSVTTINAFHSCPSLTSIRFSDNLAVIGSAVFEECYSLSSVTLPGSLRNIGSCAFALCNLSSVNVAEGAETEIFDFFYGRYNENDYHDYLYHIALPSGAVVGYGAFCENPLPHDNPDFILPADTRVIESEAFSGTDARFVWISEKVESIGDNAFTGCQNLKYVFIPYSCNSIGKNTFPEGTKILVYDSDYVARKYAENNGYEQIIFEYPFGGNG